MSSGKWWPFCLGLNVLTHRHPVTHLCIINSLRPRPNRRYFADDIFKCIFENENEWISPRISLKFVPKVRINNIPALVQIMAWRLPGDKPLSELMMVDLLTHICVTRPQWVNLTITASNNGLSSAPPQSIIWTNAGSLLIGTTSNGSWCMGIKGEMSGTVGVTFTWYMYIYELFIAFVCFVVCSLL